MQHGMERIEMKKRKLLCETEPINLNFLRIKLNLPAFTFSQIKTLLNIYKNIIH